MQEAVVMFLTNLYLSVLPVGIGANFRDRDEGWPQDTKQTFPPTKTCRHLFSQQNKKWPLAGVAQWIEHVNQKVSSSIPSQGTCLACRPGTQ